MKTLSLKPWPHPWLLFYSTLMLFGIVGLGYFVEQSDFASIVSYYGVAFIAYLGILLAPGKSLHLPFLFGLAILLRVILLFGLPLLSDDVYRFIWDGRLLIQGYNPFNFTPTYYIEQGIEIPGIDQVLYDRLNSPDYFTIYPPVAQAIFAFSCWLFPSSIFGASAVMKLFLIGAEIGTIILLIRLVQDFGFEKDRVLLYALNPLVIVEIAGNLHFEGAMVFFLVLALYWLNRSKLTGGAIAMSLSIASKLLPLMFLPFFIRRLGWRKAFLYFGILGTACLLLFAPLLNAVFLENFGQSLDLYFRKFEFNGSVYYLLRWIGYQEYGYNQIQYIGPALALGTLLGISTVALFEKDDSWKGLPGKMLFAITLYLLFTTTVHPWYVSLPVVLCLFTRFRYPILWSALITLTYINYSYPVYQENMTVVLIEYLLVFIFLALEISVWRKAPVL